jgi:hypothetical protein
LSSPDDALTSIWREAQTWRNHGESCAIAIGRCALAAFATVDFVGMTAELSSAAFL